MVEITLQNAGSELTRHTRNNKKAGNAAQVILLWIATLSLIAALQVSGLGDRIFCSIVTVVSFLCMVVFLLKFRLLKGDKDSERYYYYGRYSSFVTGFLLLLIACYANVVLLAVSLLGFYFLYLATNYVVKVDEDIARDTKTDEP